MDSSPHHGTPFRTPAIWEDHFHREKRRNSLDYGAQFKSKFHLIRDLSQGKVIREDDVRTARRWIGARMIRLVWHEAPSTVLIVKKPGSDDTWKALLQIAGWLYKFKSMRILVEPNVYKQIKIEEYDYIETWDVKDTQRLDDLVDIVVCLGGDGTILWATSLFFARVPPIVSFCLGSLGFLTPFTFSDYESVISQAIQGGFHLSLRSRLSCRLYKQLPKSMDVSSIPAQYELIEDKQLIARRFVAINEIVVDRGSSPYLSNLKVFCDGRFITSVEGDGIIISTPTGSTAYSLSAGGSIVHPEVPTVLFTPICPHSLSSRPLLFPENVSLTVKIAHEARSSAFLSVDGREKIEICPGEFVEIHVSSWPVPLVCQTDESSDWFTAVQNGLSWNSRASQQQPFFAKL